MIGNTYFINDILGWFTVEEEFGDMLYGHRFSSTPITFEVVKTHMKKEQLNGKVHVTIRGAFEDFIDAKYPYKHN